MRAGIGHGIRQPLIRPNFPAITRKSFGRPHASSTEIGRNAGAFRYVAEAARLSQKT